MKFVALIVILFATQNVFAQTTAPAAQPAATPNPTPSNPPAPTQVDPRTEQCLQNGGGDACCNGLTGCQDALAQLGRETRELLNTTANAYDETPEQAARRFCRTAGGVWGDAWDGSDWRANCECDSPKEWVDGFCVNRANVDYLESICEESGGRWTGGNCDCRGRQREGGRCTGQNRIEELEQEIAELEADLNDLRTARDNLVAERDTLRGQLTQATTELQQLGVLQGRMAELEGDVQEMDRQIATFETEIIGLRNLRDLQQRLIEEQRLMIVDLGGMPPVTPDFAPGEIPGAAESTAEVAVESTRPPVGQVPTAEEDDESGCGGWCIAGIVAGALAVGVGTFLIVEYTTTYSIVSNP